MIRPATGKDLVQLMVLGDEFFEESKYNQEFGCTFDPKSFLRFIVQCIMNEKGFVWVAEKEEGHPFGFFIGTIVPINFNENEYIGTEVYMYLRPKERNGFHSKRLIMEFESWCHARGVKAIEIGCVKTMKMDRTSKFYSKMGYDKFSTGHLKKVG